VQIPRCIDGVALSEGLEVVTSCSALYPRESALMFMGMRVSLFRME
jgi:hypothetical protein